MVIGGGFAIIKTPLKLESRRCDLTLEVFLYAGRRKSAKYKEKGGPAAIIKGLTNEMLFFIIVYK